MAAAETQCMVVGLRYADDARHTAADPRRPAPAPVIIMPGGCGFSGSEAHPLHTYSHASP